MRTSSSRSQTSTWCSSGCPRSSAPPVASFRQMMSRRRPRNRKRTSRERGHRGPQTDRRVPLARRRRTESGRRPSIEEQRFSSHGDWRVYALAATPLPATIRVGRHVAHVLPLGPIAVIGATPAGESTFGEEALREQHEIVLALARRIDPLLPARFGTRMTRDQLEVAIHGSLRALTSGLEKVRGHRQMTLRLIGPPTVEPPATAALSGAAYLAERRAAAHAVPSAVEPLRAAVARFVADERVWPGRAGVRATLFHLVEREAIRKYKSAVTRAARSMPAGSVMLTGPWPPFAFAPELSG
jgi:gas vesicle protein GvpL/GvpF